MNEDITKEILASIQGLQARMDTGFVQLRTEFIQIRTDLMARMDRLQEAVEMVRGDVAVNFGATEQVERKFSNDPEIVRIMGEQLNTLARQLRRLDERVRAIEEKP